MRAHQLRRIAAAALLVLGLLAMSGPAPATSPEDSLTAGGATRTASNSILGRKW